MKHHTCLTLIATLGLSAAASAEITGAYVVSYTVMTEDFGGTAVSVDVQDLYLQSDDDADVVLNIYNFAIPEKGKVDYFQSATGAGWGPGNLGSVFDTQALRLADSFVTIGGFAQDTLVPEQTPGAGSGTDLYCLTNDPHPNDQSGWFNSSPPNLNGQVGSVADGSGGFGLGVLIGRFAFDGDFDLTDSTLEVTWNQGLGTGGQQGQFTVNVPAPGALALFGLAGFALRRRRS